MLQSKKIKRLLIGFVGGFFSVLIFHQGSLAILHSIDFIPFAPYATKPTSPFGIPQIWSQAFWGGIWGILLAIATVRLHHQLPYWSTSILLGSLLPTTVFLFVVMPIKGIPVAGGWDPNIIVTGLIINAAWGIGVAFLLRVAASSEAYSSQQDSH